MSLKSILIIFDNTRLGFQNGLFLSGFLNTVLHAFLTSSTALGSQLPASHGGSQVSIPAQTVYVRFVVDKVEQGLVFLSQYLHQCFIINYLSTTDAIYIYIYNLSNRQRH